MSTVFHSSSPPIPQQQEIINAAHAAHERITTLTHIARAATLELAAELYHFHRAKTWALLGYNSFEEYLAQPGVIGRSKAFRLIRIYALYVVELCCPTERLIEAGETKLDRMAARVTVDNVDDWLGKAASLSRSDLLKELSAKFSNNSGADLSQITCPECGCIFTQ